VGRGRDEVGAPGGGRVGGGRGPLFQRLQGGNLATPGQNPGPGLVARTSSSLIATRPVKVEPSNGGGTTWAPIRARDVGSGAECA
jgi:hypothetical protein